MSKMNLSIDLRGYEGPNVTGKVSFSKNATYIGVDVSNETIQEVTIPSNTTQSIFSASNKKFLYLESSKECDIIVNGTQESSIKPIIIGDCAKRGIFLKSSDIQSLSIVNDNSEAIKIYYIAI